MRLSHISGACDSKRMNRHPSPTPSSSHSGQALPYLEADEAGPAALLSRRAADRLRSGHLWVYRSEVEQLIPALGTETIPPGTIVTLLDSRRIPLGSALFSDSSELTLRRISAEPRVSRGEYLEDTRLRVRAALALRAPMLSNPGNTDSARLLFSEADNLPGIVADLYRDLILLQLLTQSTAQDDLREVLAEELSQPLAGLPPLRAIVERPDPRIRELENLPVPPTVPLFFDLHGKVKNSESGAREGLAWQHLRTTFHLNGLRFHYDANSGQKTGAFLDQRLNYAAAARHAAAARDARTKTPDLKSDILQVPFRALDICTYQGGFALHLARVCTHVTGVDASRSALQVAEQNLALNRNQNSDNIPAEVDWIEADAFDLLRGYDTANERFDAIVLDPPAFAKSKRAVEGALRGYKELNLRALRMLSPGGILVTCSCSHHISLQSFTETIAAAAADAGRHVRLLETRAAAPDHPEVLTLPETHYLKCLILQAD